MSEFTLPDSLLMLHSGGHFPLSEEEWAQIEHDLKFTIPLDYKTLVSTFGPGCFDNFIWPLMPNIKNQNLDLVTQINVRISVLKILIENLSQPALPSGVSFVNLKPFAISDNGDIFYWNIIDGICDSILIGDANAFDWYEFEGNSCQLLDALLFKRVQIPFFPDDFPSDFPGFVCL